MAEGLNLNPTPQDDPGLGLSSTYQKNLYMKLADLFAGYIDVPNQPKSYGAIGNPTNPVNPSYGEFAKKLSSILGLPFYEGGQYEARQFGETYNPPDYRGIRFLFPQSWPNGGTAEDSGQIPGYAGLQQEFLGEMIRRGYPVLGGIGQLPGFKPGFNPVGFGQR